MAKNGKSIFDQKIRYQIMLNYSDALLLDRINEEEGGTLNASEVFRLVLSRYRNYAIIIKKLQDELEKQKNRILNIEYEKRRKEVKINDNTF